MLLCKLKEISAGVDCKFPYGRTILHENQYLTARLQYQKPDNQEIIMESRRLLAWSCKYLIKVHKYHEDGYLTVYLDETWFLSHDTARMLWSDSIKSSSLSGPPLRGKRVVKCHAGKRKSFLEY